MTRLRRRHSFPVVAGIVALAVLGGATAAYAVWSTTAAVSSTATTATVSVTHALSGSSLAVTYNATTTAAVGVVTVTNTGTRTGTYSLDITATSASSTLRSAVAVEVGTATSCTTTATITGAVTGTFATTVTKTGTLAAGANVVLCVRTSMTAGNISANASTSLAASIASSITIGTWTASAAAPITFTQAVAAPTTVTPDGSAWYFIKTTTTPTLCLEAQYSGQGTGTPIVQDGCDPAGAANEQWKFTATDSGYYKIVSKNSQTTWMGAANANVDTPVQLSTSTAATAQWLLVSNTDGTVSFKLRSNTARCLAIDGGSTTANTISEIANCANVAAQKFTLQMYEVVTPPPAALSCSADGYNAYYSWPQLTGYQTEVVYRVYIGGILVNPHARGTGWDTTVQFGNGSITTAIYGSGSKAVLVQQSVSGGAWTTTGTGTLVLASSAPFLLCG